MIELNVEMSYIPFRNVCVDGLGIYCVHNRVPLLFKYSLENFSYEMISTNVCSSMLIEDGIASVVKNEDTLFIVARNHLSTVGIYDLKTNSFKTVYDYRHGFRSALIWRAQLCGEILYIIPVDLRKGISRFDIKEECFKEPIFLARSVSGYLSDNNWAHVFFEDDRIYIFPYNQSVILTLDNCEKAQIIGKKFIDGKALIENVSISDDGFIISSTDNKSVWIWHATEDSLERYFVNGISRKDNPVNLGNMIARPDFLLCASYDEPILSLVSRKTGDEKVIDISKVCMNENFSTQGYISSILDIGNAYYVLTNASEYNYLIDVKGEDIKPISTKVLDKDFSRIQHSYDDHAKNLVAEKMNIRGFVSEKDAKYQDYLFYISKNKG